MTTHVNLVWKDPSGIDELKYRNDNLYGVYLWGFNIEKTFKPYYLGIALNITFRLFEHANNLLGGKYTIFHRDSLCRFEEYKHSDVQKDFGRGRVYIPDWPKGYSDFLANRKTLRPHLDFMIDNFTYSYAVVDPGIISSQALKDIEKVCISQIGITNLINTRGGDSQKITLEHSGNKMISSQFKRI